MGYSQSLPGVFFFYDISPIKVVSLSLATRLYENRFWNLSCRMGSLGIIEERFSTLFLFFSCSFSTSIFVFRQEKNFMYISW